MKISIITATWNRADTIRDTIESVLNQTHQNWEHIIVDGCSSDSTINIIKEYEVAYNGRLILISEPDKGIYDAMNKGVAAATGDVVGTLNADDFFADVHSLTAINEAFEKYDIDAVYGDNMIVDFNDTTRQIRHHVNTDFSRWKMRLGFMPSHPTFYCKKWVFDRFGGFNDTYKIAADFEWLLRTVFIGNIKTHYIRRTQTKMRDGGASQSGWKSHKTVIAEHKRAFKENGVWSCTAFELYRMGYRIIRKHLGLSY